MGKRKNRFGCEKDKCKYNERKMKDAMTEWFCVGVLKLIAFLIFVGMCFVLLYIVFVNTKELMRESTVEKLRFTCAIALGFVIYKYGSVLFGSK